MICTVHRMCQGKSAHPGRATGHLDHLFFAAYPQTSLLNLMRSFVRSFVRCIRVGNRACFVVERDGGRGGRTTVLCRKSMVLEQ